MSSQIFFNDGGDGLSYVKFTCARDGIVAAAAVDGSVAATAGYGSAVGCKGVSGGLVTGADGDLRL